MTKWALLNNKNVVVSVSKKKFEAAGIWKKCSDQVTRGWYLEGSKLVPAYNKKDKAVLVAEKVQELKKDRDFLLSKGFENNGIMHFADYKSISLAHGKLQLLQLTKHKASITWDGYDPETGKRKRDRFESLTEYQNFVIKMGAFVEDIMQKYLDKVQEIEILENKKDVHQFNVGLKDGN